MLQVSAHELGKKEKEMMKPERVEDKTRSSITSISRSSIIKSVKQLKSYIQKKLLIAHAYIMLAVEQDKTYPMGVILFKTPEYNIEKEALKAHLRKFMECLDE